MAQLYTVKEAATRWQKELGRLGARELGRLGLTAAPASANAVRKARGALYRTGTDLTKEQLARHRQLNGLQANQLRKNFFTVAPTAGYGSYPQSPIAPPASQASKVMAAAAGPRMPQRAIGTVDRGVLTHELGEYQMGRGYANAERLQPRPNLNTAHLDNYAPDQMRHIIGAKRKDIQLPRAQSLPPTNLQYAAAVHGSHLGTAAPQSEMVNAFRDPAARRYARQLRQQVALFDERRVFAKAKQFGATPASPLPLGGKAHYKLDQWARNEAPLPLHAIEQRAVLGTPTTPKQRQTAEGIATVMAKAEHQDYLARNSIAPDAKFFRNSRGMKIRVQSRDEYVKSQLEDLRDDLNETKRKYVMPANAQRQFMGLLSGLRNDSALVPSSFQPGAQRAVQLFR